MSVHSVSDEGSERPRYVIDVGTIRVVVDNMKDASVLRRIAKERAAALRARSAS